MLKFKLDSQNLWKWGSGRWKELRGEWVRGAKWKQWGWFKWETNDRGSLFRGIIQITTRKQEAPINISISSWNITKISGNLWYFDTCSFPHIDDIDTLRKFLWYNSNILRIFCRLPLTPSFHIDMPSPRLQMEISMIM